MLGFFVTSTCARRRERRHTRYISLSHYCLLSWRARASRVRALYASSSAQQQERFDVCTCPSLASAVCRSCKSFSKLSMETSGAHPFIAKAHICSGGRHLIDICCATSLDLYADVAFQILGVAGRDSRVY
jgi:hypothetical protein